ncbi:MAG: GNAT family N-acetyltransferase [Phycisphaeraceae bacterium]|nr:GNAT family N-acetyltransferase [Phycisphaeraceae bacterium]
MASIPMQRAHQLARLTTAAKLARALPDAPVRVDPPEVLRTARLALRPLAWSDREEFIRALRETRDAATEYCPIARDGERDDETFDRLLDQCRAGDATDLAWRRIAEDRAGRIVGAVNLNDITHGLSPRAELNFWIRTTDTGRGLATEIINAAIAHAFGPRCPRLLREGTRPGLGLSRIDALVAPGNSPSLAIMRALKFAIDAEHPSCRLVVGGRLVEHVRFTRWCDAERAARGIDELHPRFARTLDAVTGIENRAAQDARESACATI